MWFILLMSAKIYAQPLVIRKTPDFAIDGKGNAKEWSASKWLTLTQREGKRNYETKVKLLYSDSGVYCLFHNTDEKITSTMSEDYSYMWK